MGALTLEQFMGHSARGSKRNFLKNWKEKDPYSIVVWLHTMASILAIWRHRFIRIVRREVDGKAKVEIWSDNLVCWEDEDLLQVQNYYDRDTGFREKPPTLCGHCMMLEWIWQEIRAGKLDWREPLFKYECDDPSKTVWLHAGGMCAAANRKGSGMFGDKELTADRKKQMVEIPVNRGGPIYQKNAFKQNSATKLEYVFSVVDNAEVGKGTQVAVEPNLLGQKVQELIANAIKSATMAGLNPDIGNPAKNPYAIMFEHNPADNIEFGKKYSAVRMEHMRITPAIRRLIVDEPPPDVSGLANQFDPNTHLANLERHCLCPDRIPLASFFARSREEWKKRAAAKPQGDSQPVGRVPDVGTRLPPPPPAENPDEEVRCGAVSSQFPQGCPTVMKMRDPKCPGCGKVYIIQADPLPLPPPMRTRSAPDVSQLPTPSDDYQAPNGGDPSDDIPF